MMRHKETYTQAYFNALRDRFEDLPLLSRGESKEIRIIDDNAVMVRLIPSLYSYTKNRCAMISGTDKLRLEATKILWAVLEENGVKTSVIYVGEDYYVSQRICDLGEDHIPPIEVIVKACHVGTPKHSLYNIGKFQTRQGGYFKDNQPHPPYVRFDYTNPLTDDQGNRLEDKCLSDDMAECFIDTKKAKATALSAFSILYKYLSARGVRLDDICFKIDASGEIVFGEISQDCMRAVKVAAHSSSFNEVDGDLSKDTFRKGASDEEVLAKYQGFNEIISQAATREELEPMSYEYESV
jgi:phosphoribosylaminoimidazole-succinocarboxamide synthase